MQSTKPLKTRTQTLELTLSTHSNRRSFSNIMCAEAPHVWDGAICGAFPTDCPKCTQDFPHTPSSDSCRIRSIFARDTASFWFQLHSSLCCKRHCTFLRSVSTESTTKVKMTTMKTPMKTSCSTEVRHLLLSSTVCAEAPHVWDGLTCCVSTTDSPKCKQDFPHTPSSDSCRTCSTQELLPQSTLPSPGKDMLLFDFLLLRLPLRNPCYNHHFPALPPHFLQVGGPRPTGLQRKSMRN